MEENKKIDQILEIVQGLAIDVSGLKSDVSVLKSDVSDLKSDVSILKSDVSVLKSDVSVLKSDVSVLKTDLKSLREFVEDQAEALQDFSTHVDEQFLAMQGQLNTRFVTKEYLDDKLEELRMDFGVKHQKSGSSDSALLKVLR